MKLQKTVLIMLISILLAALMSCGDNGEKDEGKTEENSEVSKGHDESGEDSAAELGLNDTYDVKRKGARLVMKYDAESNSFIGTVTNLRGDMLENLFDEVEVFFLAQLFSNGSGRAKVQKHKDALLAFGPEILAHQKGGERTRAVFIVDLQDDQRG